MTDPEKNYIHPFLNPVRPSFLETFLIAFKMPTLWFAEFMCSICVYILVFTVSKG